MRSTLTSHVFRYQVETIQVVGRLNQLLDIDVTKNNTEDLTSLSLAAHL